MLRKVFPLLLFLFIVLGLYGNAKGFENEILPDSLYSACERIVITHEELSMYNIHTLLDVIKLVPGVNFWIKGPDGAPAGISMEGGESRGFSLYLNGIPNENSTNSLSKNGTRSSTELAMDIASEM